MTSPAQPGRRWRVALDCGHMGELASPVEPGSYLSCWSVSGAVRGCQTQRRVTSVAEVTAPPPPPRAAITGSRGGEIMHECPADGCQKQVANDMLMCSGHWYKVPAHLRKAVWRAWDNGAGAGSDEHNRAITAAIAAVNAGRM